MGAIGFAQELKCYRALSPDVRDQATAWLHLILAVLNSRYSGFKGVAVTMGYGPLTLCQTTSMERLSSVALDFVQREIDAPELVDWSKEVKSSKLSYTGEEVCVAQRLTCA